MMVLARLHEVRVGCGGWRADQPRGLFAEASSEGDTCSDYLAELSLGRPAAQLTFLQITFLLTRRYLERDATE